MTEPLRFATADRLAGSVLLPRQPMRYKVMHWDDGCTSIRAVHGDGTAGPWAHYPAGPGGVTFGEGGHCWPAEDGPERACVACSLLYAQWSEDRCPHAPDCGQVVGSGNAVMAGHIRRTSNGRSRCWERGA